MKKVFLGLFIPLALSWQAWPQDEPPILTLEEVLETSLRNSLEIRLTDLALDTAEADFGLAQAKNNFNLTASGSYGAAQGFGDSALSARSGQVSNSTTQPHTIQGLLTLTNPLTKATLSLTQTETVNTSSQSVAHASNLALNLTQTVWDGYPGGQAAGLLEKSSLGLRNEHLSDRDSREELRGLIRKAFLGALLAQRNLELFQDLLDQKLQLHRQIETRYKLSQASLLDLKDAEINQKMASIDLEAGRYAWETSRNRLAALMRTTGDFLLADPADGPVLSTLDMWIQRAQSQRSEFRLLELRRQVLAIEERLAYALASPSLALTAGANLLIDWDGEKNAQAVNFGLKVGLPLLDGGLAQKQLDLIAHQKQTFDLQKEQLDIQVRISVEEAWNALGIKEKKRALAIETAEKQELQYQIVRSRFDSGTATLKDLLDAQTAWSSARFAVIRSQVDAHLARWELEKLAGGLP